MKEIMKREGNIYAELKWENRNRIFNKIREAGSISRPSLAHDLQLSLPTVTQNLLELGELGYIYENGSFGHTGGRRAKAYSVVKKSKVAVGLDITRNHISVIMVDLCGDMIYKKRIRCPFSWDEDYMETLSGLTADAISDQGIVANQILGVGIAVPGLITEDHEEVYYGKILDFTGLTVKEISNYIPYPCRLYNDADAAGYAETSQNRELSNAFYISLSNNIGGAVLIDHKVYKGESPRSGEIGHMTIVPDGKACYCGQKGCFESYCNASILANLCDGDLETFFRRLTKHDGECEKVWEEYLNVLAIAVNNIRMLFDCKIILGGYAGAHMDQYLEKIREMAVERNTFEENAEYLRVCEVKKEALALGAALPFVHEFWKTI